MVEFEGSCRIVELADTDASGKGITQRIHDEIRKFGDTEINRCLSQTKSTEHDKTYRLQKWSEKWECYVDVDANDITKMKDGDRIAIIKTKKSEVKVSLASYFSTFIS